MRNGEPIFTLFVLFGSLKNRILKKVAKVKAKQKKKQASVLES